MSHSHPQEASRADQPPTPPAPTEGSAAPRPAPGAGPGGAQWQAPGPALAGRYTVLDRLGQGAMGVVLAAYDSRLDRRVALKLLRRRGGSGAQGAEEEQRLVREAQAMARLNHPHVVTVYDSGQLEDGSVFIAMEYVQGQTLRRWCRQQSRSWREVLQAYLHAGQGLAAAHEAGIIHRDFKPDNVLVGEQGRAKVVDFGLARVGAPKDSSGGAPGPGLPSSLETPLTQSGTLMGTPAYMAPELLQGEAATVYSDVYAFCVSLYEALYGQLPFPARSLAELSRAKAEGRVAPPPADSQVPTWVARTVLRGLQAAPSQRPGSMQELLEALSEDPEVERKVRQRAGLVACSVALLGVLAAWGWVRGAGPGCSAMERRLAGVWDEVVRQRVRAALEGTGLAYARDTAERVEGALNEYSRRWVAVSEQVCRAGQEQGGRPGGLLAAKEVCLERRRSQLSSLTEVLAQGGDKAVVIGAVQAAKGLPPLEYCLDERALSAAVPPPEEPATRARVEALEKRADRLEALQAAGKYKQGLEEGQGLLEEVRALGYAALSARALYLVARLKDLTGDYAGAEAMVREAIVEASRGRDAVLEAWTWGLLIRVVGYRQMRNAEALEHELALQSALARANNSRAQAGALNTVGAVLEAAGRYTQAREYNERALALLQQELGPESYQVAIMLNNLGILLRVLGEHPRAREHHERALDLRRKLLGPEHPEVAVSLSNLGTVLHAVGQYEQAREHHERALALRHKVLGPRHPDIATSLENLGTALVDLGQYEQARGHIEQALALRRELLGPEHPRTAAAIGSLGLVMWQVGQYGQAREHQERALALALKALGPEHLTVALSLRSLGLLLQDMGQYERAREHQERALALLSKALGPEHLEVSMARVALGRALVRLGRLEEAAGQLGQALALEKQAEQVPPYLASALLGWGELHLARGEAAQAVLPLERALGLASPAGTRAEVQWTLAQALWATGTERPRSRELAAQARAYWQQSNNPPRLAQLSQWLARHP